jgi:uncharacterized protein (TIGR02646 family)
MRRQIKDDNSVIVSSGWKHPKHTTQIQKQLLVEQNAICAYTETYLGRTDKKEIEHFNPTLKNTEEDGYQNWFLVKAQWNNEKGSTPRWLKHQQLIHPTAEDFEKRIIYLDGEYIWHPDDKEAENLIKYLKLDDKELTSERKNYIERRREAINNRNITAQEYFDSLLEREPNRVYFIRAIETEFGITIHFVKN